MPEISICPKFEGCPIYNEKITLYSQQTLEIYKHNYCMAGEENYTKCKRYIFVQETGKPAPLFVLPNSELSVQEILQKMEQDNAQS